MQTTVSEMQATVSVQQGFKKGLRSMQANNRTTTDLCESGRTENCNVWKSKESWKGV